MAQEKKKERNRDEIEGMSGPRMKRRGKPSGFNGSILLLQAPGGLGKAEAHSLSNSTCPRKN